MKTRVLRCLLILLLVHLEISIEKKLKHRKVKNGHLAKHRSLIRKTDVNPNDLHKDDINVTKIYDHVSKYHKSFAKTTRGSKRSRYEKHGEEIWQYDPLPADANADSKPDEMENVIPEEYKNPVELENGIKAIRRSDCITANDCFPGGGGSVGAASNPIVLPSVSMVPGMPGIKGHRHYHPFRHELFQPGMEKTYEEPLALLNRHDHHGPYHRFENNGHTIDGGLDTGSAIVTHQIDFQSSPSQVFMQGMEKTQPGVINGGYLQPSPISFHMPDVHIHKKPVHLIKQHFKTSYLTKDDSDNAGNPCMNGGLHFHLGHTQQCICQQAFMGKHCQEKNYCYPNPCNHDSHCQNIKEEPYYKCICKRGYFGENCQYIDPCYPNPCKNQGICTHDNQNATCICRSRYRGARCELLSNCQPNPCLNGGTCAELQGEGKFECQCDAKWKGTLCEKQSFCRNNPCQNGGTCREADDRFECTCANGYHGATCTERVCMPNPCSNGGTCVEDGENFRCICHPWNTGDLCDINRPCLVKPCLHDGTCIDAYSGYHWSFGNLQYYCLCKQPYKGMNCEIHPCKNCHKNAHCEIDHCVCDDGYEGNGENCQKIIDPCHPNPCFNQGICIPDSESCSSEGVCGFKCECNPPFRPPLCKEKNPCEPNPCVNGVCGYQQGSQDEFVCSCDDGYKGRLCNVRDACKPNPCQHSGTCTSANGTAMCGCLGHWSLPFCKECNCPTSAVAGVPSMTCSSLGACECPSGYQPDMVKLVCKKDEVHKKTYCEQHDPCVNGATCIDHYVTQFTCKCLPGYYGLMCQYKSVCASQPCRNGGTCNEKDGKFLGCKCTRNYLPPFCINKVEESKSPGTGTEGDGRNPTNGGNGQNGQNGGNGGNGGNGNNGGNGGNGNNGGNGGNGNNGGNGGNGQNGGNGGNGGTGTDGGTNPVNKGPCTPNPCMNKGVCLANRGSYDCLCSLQFTGPHCEVDRCANCHPRASCVAGRCVCNKGYVGNGHNCERETCDEICVEWSTCIDGNCVCDPGYQMIHHKCVPSDHQGQTPE